MCLLIVFSGNVIHTLVDPSHRKSNLPLPPPMQCFVKTSTWSVYFWDVTPIDPLFGHIAVSAQVHHCTFSAVVPISSDFSCFLTPSLIVVECITVVLHSTTKNSCNLYCPPPSGTFSLLMLQSSFPDHCEAILSHTEPRLCHPTLCVHLV